jgi:hypothetical protein
MTKRFLIFLAAALFVAAVPAFALTITQTKDFNGISNFSRNLTFNKFNNNGGSYTLNSIQVTVALNVNGGQITIDNDGESPASGTYAFGATTTILSLDVNLVNSSFYLIQGNARATHTDTFDLEGNVGDTTFEIDPNSPDGMQYWGTLESDSKTDFVGSSAWAGYTGLGTYDIFVSTEHTAEILSDDNYIYFFATPATSWGSVTITYDYTVPEPATIALLCTGLVFLLKRKNKEIIFW